MTMKAFNHFKSKFLNPCKKLLQVFRFKLKKPVFIKGLEPRHFRHNKLIKKTPKYRITTFLSSLCTSCKKEEEEEEEDMNSLSTMLNTTYSEKGNNIEKIHYPSPVTPASSVKDIRNSNCDQKESSDSCRRFEKYLGDMTVEDGNLKDLADVEELLYSWKSLKCPVFRDLVSRFYGELCYDLFSSEKDGDHTP